MNFNQETLMQEAKKFLEIIFKLPEVEKVAMKDIIVSSINEEVSISEGIEQCYHDKYSDVDIVLWIKLNLEDFNGETPIYRKYFPRLQIEDNIFGIVFQERMDKITNKEGIRICLKSGIRIDLTCFTRCDTTAPVLPREQLRKKEFMEPKDSCCGEWDLEKADSFWFTSINALGKLMRKDYLISSHLTHMLLMEGLVIQMKLRDNQYHTNIHRYGYSEKLEYLAVDKQKAEEFQISDDNTYNHIVELLYEAVISYDNLVPMVNRNYRSNRDVFFEIWRGYIN